MICTKGSESRHSTPKALYKSSNTTGYILEHLDYAKNIKYNYNYHVPIILDM